MKDTRIKTAWIHDGKLGEKSLGHFNCDCGNKVNDVEFASGLTYQCSCGLEYDSRGWILQEIKK